MKVEELRPNTLGLVMSGVWILGKEPRNGGVLKCSAPEQGNQCEYPYPQTAAQTQSPKDAPSGMDTLCGCFIGRVCEPVAGVTPLHVRPRGNRRKRFSSHSTSDMVLQLFCTVYINIDSSRC
jgi:hypothetical protein